jgi:hypothetical protein
VWNGTSWAVQRTPSPAGALGSALYGVSCPSVTTCIAVGSTADSSNTVLALAERWNGRTWSLLPIPGPAGALGTSLYGVSCSSATACIAVGTYEDSSKADLTMAEAWNGAGWTVQAAPNPPESGLDGVSCSSSSACTAVGLYQKNDRYGDDWGPLAERWNGTAWDTQPILSPAGAAFTVLYGVSCPSATDCSAVGYYALSDESPYQALAERWNGATWTIESVPNPAGATGAALVSVSCSLAGACTATGQ